MSGSRFGPIARRIVYHDIQISCCGDRTQSKIRNHRSIAVNFQRIKIDALKFQTVNQRHDRLTLSQILILAELLPGKPRPNPPPRSPFDRTSRPKTSRNINNFGECLRSVCLVVPSEIFLFNFDVDRSNVFISCQGSFDREGFETVTNSRRVRHKHLK